MYNLHFCNLVKYLCEHQLYIYIGEGIEKQRELAGERRLILDIINQNCEQRKRTHIHTHVEVGLNICILVF